MTPENPDRIFQLFDAALQLPSEERDAYLDRECADDPAARAAVAELLVNDRQASQEEFLMVDSAPSPPCGPDDGAPAEERPPANGTRYETVRLHARGGLGEVHMARDTELDRVVAVKRIQERYADDPSSRRRFLREAAITARLEHPGIVPVHGLVHDEDGQPCYAMRFVEGDTLSDAIKRFHEADKPGRDAAERSLALRQLLGRFITVCNTIAYAHSRGVIHRDLKPSNIILGKYGETLVVDWGLAKADIGEQESESIEEQESTPFEPGEQSSSNGKDTRAGRAMGTPEYMSPEQAAGEWDQVGPASDIYSMGATLQAILTGKAPFSRDDIRAVGSRVERGQPRHPREVKPTVPPTLEAVCLKALAERPKDRYVTALELAADMEHWLADEPVSAYPEPWTARMWRWFRRHRTLAAAGVVMLLAAGVVSGVVAVLSEQGRLAVQDERDEKEKQRGRAAWSRDQALRALEVMTSNVTGDSLVMQQAISAEQKKFLTDVLPHYQKLAGEQGDDEGTRKMIAVVAYRIGLIHARLGDQKASARALEQARDLYAQLAADSPDDSYYRESLAGSYLNQGYSLNRLGQRSKAETAYRQALVLFEQLAAAFPDMPRYREGAAGSYSGLGILLYELGRLPGSQEAFRKTLALETQLVADFPAEPRYRESLASSNKNLGLLLSRLSQLSEAEKAYREALSLGEQLATDFPEVPRYRQVLAHAHHDLGNLLGTLGKGPEAEAAHRQALALREQLAAVIPGDPQYRQELAYSHTSLGLLLSKLDKRQEAEKTSRRALTLFEQLVTDFPTVSQYRQDLAMSQLNLGYVLTKLGKQPKAEELYRRALELRKQLDPERGNGLPRMNGFCYLLQLRQDGAGDPGEVSHGRFRCQGRAD